MRERWEHHSLPELHPAEVRAAMLAPSTPMVGARETLAMMTGTPDARGLAETHSSALLPSDVRDLAHAYRPSGGRPPTVDAWSWGGASGSPARSYPLLGGISSGEKRGTPPDIWSPGVGMSSDCGTCHAIGRVDMGPPELARYRDVETITAGLERVPISSIGGAYEEGTWCKFRDRVSDANCAYIDLAWSLVVEHIDIIKSYFDERDERWSCYHDALTGRDKVRVDVKKLDGYRGKGWGDVGRGGYVTINSDLLSCERALIADDSHTVAERFCVVLDLSALLVHEVRHTCFINETGAYSIEGWFRYHIQRRYGISSTRYCGQTTWRCGSSTRRRDECRKRSDLRRDVININDDSGECGVA